MSPQREAAVRYLTAQVMKYRADLSSWRRRAGKGSGDLVQRMVVDPLQNLIDDASQLLARLRGRSGPSDKQESGNQEHAETGSDTETGIGSS